MYFTVALVVTSCASVPERNTANTSGVIPDHWTATNPLTSQITPDWLGSFADPALTALVNDGLNNNFDLKVAAARVDAARQQTIIAGAGRWPQLGFLAGYVRTNSGTGVLNNGIGNPDYSAFVALFTLMSGVGSRLPNKTPRQYLPTFRGLACLWQRARRKAILN